MSLQMDIDEQENELQGGREPPPLVAAEGEAPQSEQEDPKPAQRLIKSQRKNRAAREKKRIL